jgi:dipeptidyl aminopeptidase/acylaminoacyl peptidase
VFNRFLLAAMVSASVLTASCKRQAATTAAPSVTPDLAAERAGFNTRLIRHGPSPEPIESIDPTLRPPPDAAEIEYPSGSLKLKAWISQPPIDGKRHPAVVFLHGNFVFEMRQWTGTSPYRDAGFVVLTPMLRGENGNPGEFEMMYGEVDDVVAAGRYVANLSYVDNSQVFLAGHSVGGTLAMLASMVPSPYRAVAAFSGAPDQESWIKPQEESYKVYDTTDARELRLRSPKYFAASVRCPLYLIDGDQESYFIPDTRQLAEDASKLGKVCRFETVPGDHRGSKPPAIRRSIEIFRQ